MEYIEIKRNLENYTVRTIPESLITINSKGETVVDTDSPKYFYGTIPYSAITSEGEYIVDRGGRGIRNTINVNIFLKQNLEDIGIFTDMNFTPKTPYISPKPTTFNPMVDGRVPGYPIDFYYTGPITSTGYTTDSQLKSMSSLRVNSDGSPIFKTGLNVSDDKKDIFSGVISQDTEKIEFKIGSKPTDIINTGIGYITFKDKFIEFKNEFGDNNRGNQTLFTSNNGGWGAGNTSLAALVKEEDLLGIVFKPEISSDVFINRGQADIFERHAMLSEIKTTNDIDTFRGGFISSE